jgi:hypothetical protein
VKKKQTKTKRTKRTAKKKPATRRRAPAPKRAKSRPRKNPGLAKWPSLVAKRGVMLASARGPVPSVAEAVAGEPIVGSWWSHAKAHAIFAALSAIDDDEAIKCFRLVDKKITFVHRRLWPALARLAQAGVLAPERVAAIKQEHMPSGEHRNFTISFPEWAPADVLAAAGALSVEAARSQLGDWV